MRKYSFSFVKAMLLFSVFWSASSAEGAVEITGETTFHDAVNSSISEGGPDPDPGGLLYFFVRNTSAQSDRITGCTINGTAVTALPNFKWWRVWPETMAGAGEGNSVSAVTVKVRDAVISEGQSIAIEVTTANGASATQNYTCVTPALRLSAVTPSQDMRTLNIYARNDDTAAYDISEVLINETRYQAGVDTALSAAGGAYSVAPGQLIILQVTYSEPLPSLHPLALRVKGLRGGTTPVWVGAPTRLLEAGFAIGTWSSSMPTSDEGMTFARMLGINLHVPGHTFDTGEADPYSTEETMRGVRLDLTRPMTDRFHVEGMPYVKRPHPDHIVGVADDSSVGAWLVYDEPDLFGHDSAEMLAYNQRFWKNDPDTPTWMNMVNTRSYSEYGAVTDIIGCTNYPMYSAPSHIPLTWALRKNQMSQAFEWNHLMKANTEPQRAWNWGQLAAEGTWGTQPRLWGIDYMFWSYILADSKGVIWFKYGPGYENSGEVDDQTLKGRELTRQFNPVRSLVVYGEPIDNVEAPNDVIVRTLISPEAALVVMVNDNIDVGGFAFSPSYSQNPVNGNITVTLPDWMPTTQVVQVTTAGATPVSATVDGNEVTLPFNIDGESLVWVIGAPDTTPPEAPDRLNFASYPSGAFTLAWREPFDNRGVAGYRIYRDGAQVADTPWPVYNLSGTPDPTHRYTVRAYDAAGNLGPASNPARHLGWGFEEDDYSEGWQPVMAWGATENFDRVEVVNGALELDIRDGSDPAILGPWSFALNGYYTDVAPLRFDASTYRYFRVRMTNPTAVTGAQVYFATETHGNYGASGNSVVMSIDPNAPDMKTYWVDMTAAANWNGTVTDFRLDPLAVGAPGTVRIDFIEFTHIHPELDSDGDGLPDADEYIYGTDPLVYDTDGDGFSDGEEVAAGTDPLDPESHPDEEPAMTAVSVVGLGVLAGAIAARVALN